MPRISLKFGHSRKIFLYMPKPGFKNVHRAHEIDENGHSRKIFLYMPKPGFKNVHRAHEIDENGHSRNYAHGLFAKLESLC